LPKPSDRESPSLEEPNISTAISTAICLPRKKQGGIRYNQGGYIRKITQGFKDRCEAFFLSHNLEENK
jgi:hypothetical protein